MRDEITISPAGVDDAGELLTLQRAAWVTEAQLYRDPNLPPLTETLDELRSVLVGDTLVLIARFRGRLVGAVRGRLVDDVCHIGRLGIVPDLQGNGIGSRLLTEIETRFADLASRYLLNTGNRSSGNLRLYKRHGYDQCAAPASAPEGLIFLEKFAPVS